MAWYRTFSAVGPTAFSRQGKRGIERAGVPRWLLIITVVACILALVRPLQAADTLRFGVMVFTLINLQQGAWAQSTLGEGRCIVYTSAIDKALGVIGTPRPSPRSFRLTAPKGSKILVCGVTAHFDEAIEFTEVQP
jgi:hypothetical protein